MSSNIGERKLASRLQRLGTETAYNVAAEARELSQTGKTIYPFHIGIARNNINVSSFLLLEILLCICLFRGNLFHIFDIPVARSQLSFLPLGDFNIKTPPHIIDAAKHYLDEGKTGYCDPAGVPCLREALAREISSSRGVQYNKDEVN